MKKKTKIAILGATSQIAKSLIEQLSHSQEDELYLFARSIGNTRKFLSSIKFPEPIPVSGFESFPAAKYDAIINCVGFGSPLSIRNAGTQIFEITETFDNLVLNYLRSNPDAVYINFSSGAVYGSSFDQPAHEYTQTPLGMNQLNNNDHYSIAKIHSEAKHRAHSHWNIVDLRIFSFYSRYIDLNAGFFLSDIIQCIKNKKVFITGPEDMMRDYIHPSDLLQLIKIIYQGKWNTALDAYSKNPVSKIEMLDYFKNNYGLQVRITEQNQAPGVGGTRSQYFSTHHTAVKYGYQPQYSSIEAITDETNILFHIK